MPFVKNDSRINRAGRPTGSREQVSIPVRTQKALIKELSTRAIEEHDPFAQDTLALWLIQARSAAHG